MKRTLLLSVAGAAVLAAAPALADPAPVEAAAHDAVADDAVTVDTVIVTANRNPEDPPVVAEARERMARTPGAVAVVSAETFEDRLSTGLPDILRDVPGVLAQKRYGEESRLSIRGSGIGQANHQRGVLLAQDGVPFADADGFSDFQGIDPLTARYVEVWKGGNALRFGGAQLGGAVNVVTPTGRTAESDFLLRLEGGSFGTARAQGSAAGVTGDWDGYFNVDGLITDGWREHSDQTVARATANLGHAFGEDRAVRLIVYGADLKQDIPGTLTLAQANADPQPAVPINVTNDYSRDQNLLRTTLQTRWRLGDETVFEGGVYGTTKSLYHPIFQVIDQEIQTQGAFGRFDWSGSVGDLEADLYYGLSYRQGKLKARQFLNVGGQRGAQTADAVQEAAGLDLFAEGRLFVIPRLALVAGGSYGQATRDYRRFTGLPFSAEQDFDWFAPRIGMLWQDADGVQVYANLTRSVEPPTFGALVQGVAAAFVPVTAQEAWTGEIGTRGQRGAWTWDLTFYRADVEGEMLNFIVTPDVPAATFNAGNTIHQGLEAAADWNVPLPDAAIGQLSFQQSFTWSDFHFDNDPVYGDNTLPVIPEYQYLAELTYSHPAGWFIAPGVQWRPRGPWLDYRNTVRAPGYTVWGLNAGWDFDNGVTVFVDGRNLTDDRYVSEFAAVTDAGVASTAVFFPAEGRGVFGGVRYRF